MECGKLQLRSELDGLLGTIGALFRKSVQARTSANAIATVNERLSYVDLDARSAEMARALVSIGAGKGTRIALLAPDGILWVTVFLAAMRIGAQLAPVSTHATAPELAHILRHSDTQILIGVRRFLRHDYVERLEAALPGLAEDCNGSLQLLAAPYLRSIWLDDASGLSWASSITDLTKRKLPKSDLLAEIESEVVPSDDSVIIYTSGSTSLPKAVLHTQGSIARQGHVLAEQFRVRPTDRMMPLLPAFWVGGLTMMIEVIQTGGTLIYPKSPKIEDVVEAIEELAVNRIHTWGPQVDKLRQDLIAHGVEIEKIGGLAALRTPEGDLISPDKIANTLGMTESFGPHSNEPIGTVLPEDRRGSSGRATSDFERRVVDVDRGELIGPGRSGELQLRRGGLMRGLYKVEPDKVFTPDGFFPTGDIVRMEADGHLFFERRRGDMFKTSGANVSRLEVEAALRCIPGVVHPIVVGLSDPLAGQVIAAAVVLSPNSSATEASLKDALASKLASYKIPRHIVIISADEVPWTPTNKIKLADLAANIAARVGRPAT